MRSCRGHGWRARSQCRTGRLPRRPRVFTSAGTPPIKALIDAVAVWLPHPRPTRVLGIDETRARTVCWVLADAGLATHRSVADQLRRRRSRPGGDAARAVRGLARRPTAQIRAGIDVAVIDPSAPYASGIRAALPHAQIAVTTSTQRVRPETPSDPQPSALESDVPVLTPGVVLAACRSRM